MHLVETILWIWIWIFSQASDKQYNISLVMVGSGSEVILSSDRLVEMFWACVK